MAQKHDSLRNLSRQSVEKPLLPMLPPLSGGTEIVIPEQDRWRHKTSRWRRSVVELTVLVMVVIGVWSGYQYSLRLPFDAEQWQAAGQAVETWPLRQRMLPDLFHRHRLVGMTRAEVIALLGRPDEDWMPNSRRGQSPTSSLEPSRAPHHQPGRGWHMGYYVGSRMLDPILLVLKFDGQQRVQDYDTQTFPVID